MAIVEKLKLSLNYIFHDCHNVSKNAEPLFFFFFSCIHSIYRRLAAKIVA
jgi:hypothetical protein